MAYEDIIPAGVRGTPVASAARTTTGTSGIIGGTPPTEALRAQLEVTAASGTSPTLDVIIQDSLDGGVTWNTVGTFTQATAATRQVINITTPFAPLLRVSWTIGGTTPSFTFAIVWHGLARRQLS